ncbi:MAG: 50S ribosomal protein L30 [Nanoarchaeota archaeon]
MVNVAKLAVIVVRGEAKVSRPIVDTLRLLRLERKNHCVVVEDTPSLRGMINKVKDYVTWGELSEENFQELVRKRGKLYLGRLMDSQKKYQYQTLLVHGKHYKSYFTLNPPRQGFGRKGIKMAFSVGGALGYRGDKINDLIQRMI